MNLKKETEKVWNFWKYQNLVENILQAYVPLEPERAAEARRAVVASGNKKHNVSKGQSYVGGVKILVTSFWIICR